MQARTSLPVSIVPSGFTLIELLVTVTVAAILLGLAAPSFRDIATRNRLANSSNDVISSVIYARSEAVRRGETISICSSANGTSCGGTWNNGWIIFVNVDNDSPAAVDDGELVLKVFEGLTNGYTLNADAALASGITYARDGSANNTGLFAVCRNGRREGARAIVLTRLRPRIARDTNNDRIPNRDDGTNIASCAAPGA
jgi:type IV fimbrial biogenesis protein FimT